MSSARPANTISYQIEIEKEGALESLRYGRFTEGSMAKSPYLKPWTVNSFLARDIAVSTTCDAHRQVLVPTSVTQTNKCYTITGTLRAVGVALTEAEELAVFTANNEYDKKSETLYQFSLCRIDLTFTKPGLFNGKSHHVTESVNAHLNHLIEGVMQSIVSNTSIWKFNKAKNVGWIIVDDAEALVNLQAYLVKTGISKDKIEINKTKDGGKPLLIVQEFNCEKLQQLSQHSSQTSHANRFRQ